MGWAGRIRSGVEEGVGFGGSREKGKIWRVEIAVSNVRGEENCAELIGFII